MKTQVNIFKISGFPKILSLTLFDNSSTHRSISGDDLVFYFFTVSWLRFQQEPMWVNNNFERRELTSAQKSCPSPDDFVEKSFLNTKVFTEPLKNINLNY